MLPRNEDEIVLSCRQCHKPFPRDADPRQLYCSEKCRHDFKNGRVARERKTFLVLRRLAETDPSIAALLARAEERANGNA